jgi:hypothetical protein
MKSAGHFQVQITNPQCYTVSSNGTLNKAASEIKTLLNMPLFLSEEANR